MPKAAWSARIQAAWDAGAAHLARNPRKYTALGLTVAFIRDWWPWLRDSSTWARNQLPGAPVTIPIAWVPYALGLGFVALVWWETRLHKNRPASRATTRLVEFHETRQTLMIERPLLDTIKSAEVVWALWNAGSTAWAHDAHRLGRMKRLLLPDPTGSGLGLFATSVNRTVSDVANDIIGFSRQAAEAGVIVRWFTGAPGNTMIIGEPNAEAGGWIQFETLFTGAGLNQRPIVRIEQDRFPTAFQNIKDSFEKAWMDAALPAQEMIFHPVTETDARPTSKAVDQPDVSLKWLEEPITLAFELRNNTAEIVHRCGIEVTDLKLWSPEHEDWIKVDSYFSVRGEFTPFTLHGDGTIFPREKSRLLFIAANGGKFGILGRHGNAQRPLPVPKAGIWRMQVNVFWAGKKRAETVFYESFEDRKKRPCPTTEPMRRVT